MLRLGRGGPRGVDAPSVVRAVPLLYFRLRPHSRLQEQPAGCGAGFRAARVGGRAALFRGLFVRRRAPAADPGPELPRFRGGDRLRGPRRGFLRGPRAAQTVVSADRHDEDPARPAFPDFAQDGAQRGHQVGALRVHGLHLDRRRAADRPLAVVDGQGFHARGDRRGVLRRGAQEGICELHDAHLADDALRQLDRPGRAAPRLPGYAAQLRLHQTHLLRRQRIQPSQHEHRRRRPVHAAGYDPRQRERHPLAARHAARKDMGRHGLVDEPAALLRFGLPLLPAGGAHLRRLGALVAGALLRHGGLRSGGDALGI